MKPILVRRELELDSGLFKVDYLFNLPPFHCAMYTRIQAEKLFKLQYPTVDSWHLPDFCESMEFSERELVPGRVLLCENPGSKYKGKRDSRGREIVNTHTALYLGNDAIGEKIFIHQHGENQDSLSLEELLQSALFPKRIILPNSFKSS